MSILSEEELLFDGVSHFTIQSFADCNDYGWLSKLSDKEVTPLARSILEVNNIVATNGNIYKVAIVKPRVGDDVFSITRKAEQLGWMPREKINPEIALLFFKEWFSTTIPLMNGITIITFMHNFVQDKYRVPMHFVILRNDKNKPVLSASCSYPTATMDYYNIGFLFVQKLE